MDRKTFFYVGRGNLHLGGAVPPGADLYGLASHHCGLVSAEGGAQPFGNTQWPSR
jgi:hypothetical protein